MIVKNVLKKFPVFSSWLIMTFYTLKAKYKHKKSRLKPYSEWETQISDDLLLNDIAFGLFLRVLMVEKYAAVYEIGAMSGKRVINLKKLLPEISFFGLDIGRLYRTPFETHGVQFKQFNLDFFKERQGGIVLANGTLGYFSKEQLLSFFATIHKSRMDLAFFEPAPGFNVEETTIRYKMVNQTAYYHPYEKYLRDLGYRTILDEKNTYNWNGAVGYAEYTRFQYAKFSDDSEPSAKLNV